jgi:hypothetical protein
MRDSLRRKYVTLLQYPCDIEAGTASYVLDEAQWSQLERELVTSAGYAVAVSQAESGQAAADALLELRRLTGLTWEQIARLFDVARRSVHFWASGKPLSASKEEQLYRTLATIRRIDRGAASENRALLLSLHEGHVPLDLLAAGRYDEVVALVGPGSGRLQRSLPPLSRETQAMRAPRPPSELIDALQDYVHDAGADARSTSRTRPK